jgi:uncharacterized NAD(P)/FAD-binding protein YdhS
MRTIAIIGAGFSGTATAVHVLRRTRSPLRVVLIDDQPEMAAGPAYSPAQRDCLLNVPAGQMSLDASHPGEFLDFAAQQGLRVGPQDFLSRALYGRYLSASLHAATESAGIECVRIWGRVTRLVQLHDRARSWRIDLDDGHLILADEVVLATGNPQPARLAALQAIRGTRWYVHDPWNSWPQEIPAMKAQNVLLLGTGLTMADVALRLALRGPEPPEMLALSRHGLLPQSQTAFDRATLLTDAVATIRASGGSLRKLVHVVHALSRQVDGVGGDWREVINAARKVVPELWSGLNGADRQRFIRHVRPIWDVHRHRMPPAAAAELQRLQATGMLKVRAGTLEGVNITSTGIEIIWRPRGAQRRERSIVGRVFNCTGPDHRVSRSTNILVQSLLASGLISPDPLELGIRTTPDNEVIGADGGAVKGLYYVGPWLRARDWEATAVPELREHARRLADRLAGAALKGHRRQAAEFGRWRLAERASFH